LPNRPISPAKIFYSITDNIPVFLDGTEGRKALETIKAIYKSSNENKRVYVPFEE
jgi:hypothetical protein